MTSPGAGAGDPGLSSSEEPRSALLISSDGGGRSADSVPPLTWTRGSQATWMDLCFPSGREFQAAWDGETLPFLWRV